MARNSDDYAIVIGIDTYSKLYRLRSAEKDATEFAKWLNSPLGGNLPSENIMLRLGDPLPHLDLLQVKPTQRHIDFYLMSLGTEENKRIGRRLYFYFSGHGIGPVFNNVGMLMIDASLNNLNSNIGLNGYRSFFKDHHIFDEIVYILDCCRDPAPNIKGLQLRDPSFTLVENRNGVREYVVLAAEYGEKAYAPKSADNGKRRGLLTKVLLDGFEKAYDGLGRVTSSSLREYILTRVPDLVQQTNEFDKKLLDQKPEVPALPDPPIIFRTVPADLLPRVKVHIIAGPGKTGKLNLHDSDGILLETQAAKDATVSQPWEVELDRSRFVFVVQHSASGEQQSILPQMVTEEPYIVTFK